MDKQFNQRCRDIVHRLRRAVGNETANAEDAKAVEVVVNSLELLHDAADFALHKIVGALGALQGEAPYSATTKLRAAEERLARELK